jgi:hypothetical protein
MLYPISGNFEGHTIEEKQGKQGPFLVGNILIKVDNSYTPKGKPKVENFSVVPFTVIGATAKQALELRFNQLVEIQFEVKGREWNGKQYSEVRAVFIKAGSDDEIKFS